jgi:hypothetical protein
MEPSSTTINSIDPGERSSLEYSEPIVAVSSEARLNVGTTTDISSGGDVMFESPSGRPSEIRLGESSATQIDRLDLL